MSNPYRLPRYGAMVSFTALQSGPEFAAGRLGLPRVSVSPSASIIGVSPGEAFVPPDRRASRQAVGGLRH